MRTSYDVLVIGGGPAGATVGTLIKKYAPALEIAILERERFPREHVGESLLPISCRVLYEMGCWDKIEQANFPIKIGATYRWGTSSDLWDFNFLAAESFQDRPRPEPYEGQRIRTALQVDRFVYDKILLDHARECGVEVVEDCKVVRPIVRDGFIDGVETVRGDKLQARYYVDATGSSGLLRRALDIPIVEPSSLRNVAFWDYFQDAEWAVTIGSSGTRIQVMSLGWGWIWFIPIGPTRTSVGLVVPANYYKESGKAAEVLYLEAIASEPRMAALLRNATRENLFQTTKDWSFYAQKMADHNWFLTGEAAGFADPILSAGVSLAHISANEVACIIAEDQRGQIELQWMQDQYSVQLSRRIGHHIRFADYWYSANAQFTDLIEFTSDIAKDAGLRLSPEEAWQWLGTGGFVDAEAGGAGLAFFGLSTVKRIFAECSGEAEWNISKNNIFVLDIMGSKQDDVAGFRQGNVSKIPTLSRNGKTLPLNDIHGFLVQALRRTERIDQLVRLIDNHWCVQGGIVKPFERFRQAIETLEAMVEDGWVVARRVDGVPMLDMAHIAGAR